MMRLECYFFLRRYEKKNNLTFIPLKSGHITIDMFVDFSSLI
jgi:hypothetical protein